MGEENNQSRNENIFHKNLVTAPLFIAPFILDSAQEAH